MSKTIQELLDDANAKLLQASVAIVAQNGELNRLKAAIGVKDERIAALEGAARRSTLPFRRDLPVPALCRRQAG